MRTVTLVYLYKGRFYNMSRLAGVLGVARCTILRWVRADMMSEACIDSFLRERDRVRQARMLGITSALIDSRLGRKWDVDDAYSVPPMPRGNSKERRSWRRGRPVAITPPDHGVGRAAEPRRAPAFRSASAGTSQRHAPGLSELRSSAVG